MRVLICGDRGWDKPAVIQALLSGLRDMFPQLTVIEGCARGADRAACTWRKPHEHLHFPAQWDEHGRSAGVLRNQQMLDEGKPQVVFAFHSDLSRSKGTKHMVGIARKADVPVYLISKL